MKLIVLTGSETRHAFFRKKIAFDPRIEVLATYCEGDELSLASRVAKNDKSSVLEKYHVAARTQSESDFFALYKKILPDLSKPKFIQKGDINNDNVVSEIISKNPDLLVCFGSSLIQSALLDVYNGRFLNVHLGLSPYYRGSGSNIWPLINGEPEMVGATFMHLDPGIDTGKIIHQIRADIYLGDGPHSIGNRLIKKMTSVYAELICLFPRLDEMPQPTERGRLYFRNDFNSQACEKLYKNFNMGMIESYLNSSKPHKLIIENQDVLL